MRASSSDKELFAQIYTLLYFKKINDDKAIKIFRELSRYQSDKYCAWRSYQRKRVSRVNYDLRRARHRRSRATDKIGEYVVPSHYGEKFIVAPWGKKFKITYADEHLTGVSTILDKVIDGLETAMSDGVNLRTAIESAERTIDVFESLVEDDFGSTGFFSNAEKHDLMSSDISRIRDLVRKARIAEASRNTGISNS
jgi:hypothetical protein